MHWLWGNQTIVMGQAYTTKANDTVRFDHIKCYISQLKLTQKDKVVYTLSKPVHLFDLDKPESLTIKIDKPVLADAITFQIGLDSSIQVAGAKGQDLDPTNGMYWTWNTGYIILKVDGTSPTCPTRKHLFTYHIGGYKKPNQCLATVHLPLAATNNKDIELKIDLKEWIDQISLTAMPSVMEPGKEAVILLESFAKLIKL